MPPVYIGEKLAISIEDVEANGHMDLCQGRIDLEHPFIAEVYGRKDKNGKMCSYNVYAVEFICPLLVAAKICDVIRDRDRNGKKSNTRIYIFKQTSWSKVPAGTIFTERVNEQVRLLRKTFPISSGPVVYNTAPREKPEPISFE